MYKPLPQTVALPELISSVPPQTSASLAIGREAGLKTVAPAHVVTATLAASFVFFVLFPFVSLFGLLNPNDTKENNNKTHKKVDFTILLVTRDETLGDSPNPSGSRVLSCVPKRQLKEL
jgi:hypothetical protein